MTRTFVVLASGRMLLAFFSSVIDSRAASKLTCSVFRQRKLRLQRCVRHRFLKQSELKLDAQYSSHRFVDSRLRHRAFLHERDQVIRETVIVRHHAHIDARQDREACSFFFIRSDAPRRDEFLDVFPVRDDETFEAELVAQNIVRM